MTNLKKQMTTDDVTDTIQQVLNNLQLGTGSWRRSSWYHDYVCLEFAVFHTGEKSQAYRTVHAQFNQLMDRFGWTFLRVTAAASGTSIMVTMQVSGVVSGSDRKMPYRAEVE